MLYSVWLASALNSLNGESFSILLILIHRDDKSALSFGFSKQIRVRYIMDVFTYIFANDAVAFEKKWQFKNNKN